MKDIVKIYLTILITNTLIFVIFITIFYFLLNNSLIKDSDFLENFLVNYLFFFFKHIIEFLLVGSLLEFELLKDFFLVDFISSIILILIIYNNFKKNNINIDNIISYVVIVFFFFDFKTQLYYNLVYIKLDYIYNCNILYNFLFDVQSTFNNNWYPFIDFLEDNVFLQTFMIYLIYSMSMSYSLYSFLFYMFILISIIGILLCTMQLELLGAFLLVSEFLIIFITVLLLLYLNKKNNNNNNKNINIYIIPIFIILCFINIENNQEYDFLETNFAINDSSYINYYELFKIDNTNDLTPLYINYYNYNSICLIILGYILLIGSLICISIYKNILDKKTINYNYFFKIYRNINKFNNYLFLRTQNLNKQTKQKSSSRFFKKKND